MSDHLRVEIAGSTGIAERTDRGWEVSLSAGTGRLGVDDGRAVLQAITDAVAGAGGGTARWRVPAATPEHARIADAVGWQGHRRLVQMRRSLPLPWHSEITTRAFDPDIDAERWLEVNNAAFAWHPEQSGWTRADLDERLAEPWFDAEGFRVHPVTGPLDAFCWTKVHHDVDPHLGEIFVIAVHPDAAGAGLGRQIVLAGLDHLAAGGLGTAMLYTEADNLAALALYERLGFTVHHEVTVFERAVEPQTPTPMADPIA
ncbi:MAG: mycothiol synthase [Acidimicrobiales bacterium]